MRNKTDIKRLLGCLLLGGFMTISTSLAVRTPGTAIPYLKDTVRTRSGLDPAEQVNGIDTVHIGDTLRTSVQLYFRWDKDILDSGYMSNRESLLKLQELLSIKRLRAIDSIQIKAYASPEGPPLYNLRLSERRGKEVKKVLLWKFPHLDADRITYEGMGENWVGFREVIEADTEVPSRDKVLRLLNLPLSLVERDRRLQAMDGGIPYRYIFRKYYKRLRNASSIYLSIIPRSCVEIPPMRGLPVVELPDLPLTYLPLNVVTPVAGYHYIRPVAVKTNLLFDVALMPNIELEFPIGRQFSVLGEWTFPWWGGLGNDGGVSPVPVYSEKFTMQMLSGGVEARYWFPRSKRLDRHARKWGDYNPLVGWFAGLYAGAGLYDFQFGGNGMQGEFYIASGISAGFAHPVGKYFHMEYSLGVGYLSTRYYRYSPRDGHKVVIIRSDGTYDRRKQTWFGPTKAKISLVWIPRFKVKTKMKGVTSE